MSQASAQQLSHLLMREMSSQDVMHLHTSRIQMQLQQGDRPFGPELVSLGAIGTTVGADYAPLEYEGRMDLAAAEASYITAAFLPVEEMGPGGVLEMFVEGMRAAIRRQREFLAPFVVNLAMMGNLVANEDSPHPRMYGRMDNMPGMHEMVPGIQTFMLRADGTRSTTMYELRFTEVAPVEDTGSRCSPAVVGGRLVTHDEWIMSTQDDVFRILAKAWEGER